MIITPFFYYYIYNMTLNEIAYSIRNQLTGFVSSDDTRIDIQFIYKKIHDVRALLIKQELDRTGRVNDASLQRLDCLEIKCGYVKCNGYFSSKEDFYIDLPKMIGGLNHRNIQYLGSSDLENPFTRVGLKGFTYSDHSLLTGNKPRFTVIGDLAIIKNLPTEGMKYATMIGVLSDPSKSCSPVNGDDEYPIADYLIHQLETIVLQQLISTLQIPTDEKNNAIENIRKDEKPREE